YRKLQGAGQPVLRELNWRAIVRAGTGLPLPEKLTVCHVVSDRPQDDSQRLRTPCRTGKGATSSPPWLSWCHRTYAMTVQDPVVTLRCTHARPLPAGGGGRSAAGAHIRLGGEQRRRTLACADVTQPAARRTST